MSIGNKIKTLREGKGITPKVFADKIDKDVSTLNRIESGKISTFSPKFLKELADNLGVGIAELFDENSPIAIQHTEKGDNIGVLHQQNKTQTEKIEYYEQLLLSKDEVIKSKDEVIKSKDVLIESKDELIKSKDELINSLKATN